MKNWNDGTTTSDIIILLKRYGGQGETKPAGDRTGRFDNTPRLATDVLPRRLNVGKQKRFNLIAKFRVVVFYHWQEFVLAVDRRSTCSFHFYCWNKDFLTKAPRHKVFGKYSHRSLRVLCAFVRDKKE